MSVNKANEKFYDAIQSLKKYRRADLEDGNGRSLIEKLYIDPLPEEHILKKCVQNHTTFLIGRKGTGKSTIFLRLEQEFRKQPNFLPCYIDTKTVFESASTDVFELSHLKDALPPKLLRKYLVERSFIQAVLARIVKEVASKYDGRFDDFKRLLKLSKVDSTLDEIRKLTRRIEDNYALSKIEIPLIKSIVSKTKGAEGESSTKTIGSKAESKAELDRKEAKVGFGYSREQGSSSTIKVDTEKEQEFTEVFLQLFQIKQLIAEIQGILKELGIKHLFILLDDFSEIEDQAMRTFVDVVLAPLNNWSDDFIKFKVAAYPGRIYFGKVDVSKVDVINLDFYQLYSAFDRNKMEDGAVDFTQRLLEKRCEYYCQSTPEVFFDVSKNKIEDFYRLLFEVSMNVPRIMGYILSFCYESTLIYGRRITRGDIMTAANTYYLEKVEPFFDKTTFSLLQFDEKINILQQRELLENFVERMLDIRKKISTNSLTGSLYSSRVPYCSHFHFSPELEPFLKTLELNFFISKYNTMSDKDGKPVSVYALNYGLTQERNLVWGKPMGNDFRKYFVQRPFNFTDIISEFLSTRETIRCQNPDCAQLFSNDQKPFLEFSGYICNICKSPVEVSSLSEDISEDLKKLKENSLLNPEDIELLFELLRNDQPVTARDIAEEVDLSSKSVSKRAKRLEKTNGLVKRTKLKALFVYESTIFAKSIYGSRKDDKER